MQSFATVVHWLNNWDVFWCRHNLKKEEWRSAYLCYVIDTYVFQFGKLLVVTSNLVSIRLRNIAKLKPLTVTCCFISSLLFHNILIYLLDMACIMQKNVYFIDFQSAFESYLGGSADQSLVDSLVPGLLQLNQCISVVRAVRSCRTKNVKSSPVARSSKYRSSARHCQVTFFHCFG